MPLFVGHLSKTTIMFRNKVMGNPSQLRTTAPETLYIHIDPINWLLPRTFDRAVPPQPMSLVENKRLRAAI